MLVGEESHTHARMSPIPMLVGEESHTYIRGGTSLIPMFIGGGASYPGS